MAKGYSLRMDVNIGSGRERGARARELTVERLVAQERREKERHDRGEMVADRNL